MKHRIELTLAAVIGAGALQAHAQAPAAGTYEVRMDLGIHGEATSPRLLVRENEAFAVAGEHGGKPWRVEFTLDKTSDAGSIRLAGKITEGGQTLAAPVLVGKLGEQVGVKVGDDLRVAMVVRQD